MYIYIQFCAKFLFSCSGEDVLQSCTALHLCDGSLATTADTETPASFEQTQHQRELCRVAIELCPCPSGVTSGNGTFCIEPTECPAPCDCNGVHIYVGVALHFSILHAVLLMVLFDFDFRMTTSVTLRTATVVCAAIQLGATAATLASQRQTKTQKRE